jgi:cytochrome c
VARVGLTVLNTTDAAGNPLFREMIDTTRATPEGTVRYMWLNRMTNKVEPKVSYVRKVGTYVVGVGYSAPRSTADDARAMLGRAVALARADGPAKAAATFNDRRGAFVKDDLYVFMVNLDSGRFEAMGMNPALSDTDARGLADAAGHAIVAEMIEKLKTADEATVDYVWRNPVTNRVEKKRSYVRREGGSLIGVGHYME